ncbi:unnamed protein product [Lactuca virosa]|uniref:Uncharacterized protein n=1 Tax=Lactuca virosa TaxID=75947 RepID=A0AAU9NUY1_9ASTR|nr:unnamed protein product [Lactuca virosa]
MKRGAGVASPHSDKLLLDIRLLQVLKREYVVACCVEKKETKQFPKKSALLGRCFPLNFFGTAATLIGFSQKK